MGCINFMIMLMSDSVDFVDMIRKILMISCFGLNFYLIYIVISVDIIICVFVVMVVV